MNILMDELPEAVEVDGEICDLNTDFRTGIKIMTAFEDPELAEREKLFIMIELLYQETPGNLEEACRQGIRFLNCGETKDADDQTGGHRKGERLYSFEKDANYIYSAIKQSHGIDLEENCGLHWWKFCCLFLDIKEECFFSRMIYYRKQGYQGKLTKEEREYCHVIRNILELPTVEDSGVKEAEDKFMELLRGGSK